MTDDPAMMSIYTINNILADLRTHPTRLQVIQLLRITSSTSCRCSVLLVILLLDQIANLFAIIIIRRTLYLAILKMRVAI